MEQPNLTEQTEQTLIYFANGCDKDGFAIENIAHLQFAYSTLSERLHRDLGPQGAFKVLKEQGHPQFVALLKALVSEI